MSFSSRLPPLALLCSLAACQYPTTHASTVETHPHLTVSHASPTALLLVDGAQAGPAANFAPDKSALTLETGTHTVTITDQGRTLLSSTFYFGAGTDRTVDIP